MAYGVSTIITFYLSSLVPHNYEACHSRLENTPILTFFDTGHKFVRPKGIHDPEIVEELAKDYMYFACIQFINSVRTSLFIFLARL
jgi:hypothetical protein